MPLFDLSLQLVSLVYVVRHVGLVSLVELVRDGQGDKVDKATRWEVRDAR